MLRSSCLLLLSLMTVPAFAQGDAMLELYGEGVHRYFAGDLMGADQLLSRVVDSGSQDPRAHYFRGIVRERQYGSGGLDFENGARLEAEGKTAAQVGLALVRVQGAVRHKIEKARRDARAAFLQQRLLMQEAARNTPLPTPGTGGSTVPAEPAGGDLFDLRSDSTTVDPIQPSEPEVDSGSPFGDDPVTDAPAMDAAPADSPFGGDTTPADSPFGADTPSADPPADNPFSDNPFN